MKSMPEVVEDQRHCQHNTKAAQSPDGLAAFQPSDLKRVQKHFLSMCFFAFISLNYTQ
jgi:hypothetical protein